MEAVLIVEQPRGKDLGAGMGVSVTVGAPSSLQGERVHILVLTHTDCYRVYSFVACVS